MPRSSVIFALMALVVTQGCTPSCERTCRKLLDCGTLASDRVSVFECETSCETQAQLPAGWDDRDEYDKAMDAHRRCLMRSTCDEIAAGGCYDERLFPVGIPTTELDTGP